MTSRERFAAAMARRSPDRPPIDLGSTSLTGMSIGCRARLMQALGFMGGENAQGRALDERILLWAGTDFRSVGGIVQLPSSLGRRISDEEYVDFWGIRRRKAGQYWDIVGSPLRGATSDDLARYPWPEPRIDDRKLEELRDRAKYLRERTDFVVIGEHPVLGVLELGCWMCGYDDFLSKFAIDPDFIRRFFDRYFAIQAAIIEQYYGAIGPYIDLTISGDDFGMQSGPLLSPAMFREFVAPYFTERIRMTKEIARCYYWHHSCGSVAELLDEIIACGVDILNPVQTSAAAMDPAVLKESFGDRIVFWGAVDVQDFLRTSSPAAVRRGVRRLIETLGRNGGYVVAPAHNVQDDVPPENILAMIEEARSTERR